MKLRALSFSLASAAALAALTLLSPSSADACGGTFCDAGPTVMPVDQTGESIVFWIDEGGDEPFTEAHIQIQYEGEAENFAWIIPVTEVPEVLVGNQALFNNLLNATVPVFTTNTRSIGDCSGGGSIGLCGDDAAFVDEIGALSSGGFEDEGGWEEGEAPGPEILDRGFAGAFEYVTLTGDNIDEIIEWLDTNNYAQDEDAPPILQEYLDEGFVFVAVKLRSGADVDEIHPLAIRYPGTEPCIPIRLTRIAAIDDMAIRAFFLNDKRVAPSNWPHVVLNYSRFDWVNGPAFSYDALVGLAVDEAGGRAWVTEFAGTSAVVSTTNIYDPQWDPSAFEGVEPTAVTDILEAQDILTCNGTECFFGHPQVEALLQTYLPAPDGVSEAAFWTNLEGYADQIDMDAWNQPPGFATSYTERISGPGSHALDMLDSSSGLTRLYTLISPHEMIEDPLFHPVDGLGPVDNNIVATRVNDCDGGPTFYEIPGGRIVAETEGGAMPQLEGNPAAERIETVPLMGPPQVETNNTPTIDKLLNEYNDGRKVGPQGGCTISRVNFEGALAIASIFGIALFSRRRRR